MKAFEMPPSSGKKPKVERPDIEEEALSDFEALLIEASKINEGKEGIITMLSFKDMPQPIREVLLGEHKESFGEFAMKIIKIYQAGKGKAEFEAQQAAYQALVGHADAAQVPRPYLYRDVPVKSAEARRMLSSRYGYDEDTMNVEILVMDLIDGDDLGTLMLKEAIRRDKHKLVNLKDRVDGMGVNDLMDRVGAALGYSQPGGKGKTLAEKANERYQVFEENAGMLYKDLQKKGFKLPPDVRKKLKKALDILHEKGIYHRDLHERNVMIGKDGQVYIIDFGKARLREAGSRADSLDAIYKTSGETELLRDESILDACSKLEGAGIPEALVGLVDPERVSPAVKENLEHFRSRLEAAKAPLNEARLQGYLRQTLSVEPEASRMDTEAAILLLAANWDDDSKKVVQAFAEKRLRESGKGTRQASVFSKILEELKDA